jgi:hypothetical protein
VVIATKRTVTIEVTKTIELTVSDEVLAELMSQSWQSSFYRFGTENEALAWLGWVVDEWHGPQHVDGLAGFTDEQISTRAAGLDYEVA